MGVATSKNKTEQMLETVFSSKTFNKCPTVKIQLEQEVGDIVIKDGCDATIAIKQEAFFEDKCTLEKTINSLTDFYVKNKQDIEDGLVPNIVNVSNTESSTSIRSEIQAELENICTEVDVTESQHVGNIYCEGGRLKLPILQKFYGKTACVVDELIKRADEWESKQEQDVTRASGFLDGVKKWFTMQMVMGIVVVVAILLIIGGLLWYLNSNPEVAQGATSAVLLAGGVPPVNLLKQ